jgi:hypothetical protein
MGKYALKPTKPPSNFKPSSPFWDIFMNVPDEQRLNQIIHILNVNCVWAFVWTRRLRTENYYILYGYIMLTGRETRDWFFERLGNLGKGKYNLAHMHPNKYRLDCMDAMDAINGNLFEVVVRIERGSYIAGTGPY